MRARNFIFKHNAAQLSSLGDEVNDFVHSLLMKCWSVCRSIRCRRLIKTEVSARHSKRSVGSTQFQLFESGPQEMLQQHEA